MARPIKAGVDYFPHDCDASSDEKIEALRALHGNDGYAFYFILLERIFRAEKGELSLSIPSIKAALIKKVGVTLEKFEEILATAFEINAFDKRAYDDRNALTSHGIQRRFRQIQSQRERWRRNKSKGVILTDNGEENGVKTPESKEKKRKGNEIIITPEENEFISELEQIENYPLDHDKDLAMYRALAERYPTIDLVATVKDWGIEKISKPLTSKSNPRNQLNTWCKNNQAWGKNLKRQSEPQRWRPQLL